MQRRKAIATAGAVTAAATAAVIAFGANFGIFGLTQNDSQRRQVPGRRSNEHCARGQVSDQLVTGPLARGDR